MKKIWIILVSALALTLACNKPEEDNPKPQPDPPATSKIEIPAESQAIFSQGISLSAGTAAQSQTLKFTTTADWSTNVVDVKSSSWLSVQPTGGKAGTVTMTVTAQPNTDTKDREASVTITCGTVSQKFTVKQAGVPIVDVTSVTLDKTTLALVEGEEATLTATVAPDNATDKTVTWSTSDASIATVADGKVTAVKGGQATITAKAGDKSATCTVTVTKAEVPVKDITVEPTSLEMVEGDEATITATVTPADATNPTVSWSSSDESVATVDGGKVTAVKEGTATITAKAGDKSATCAVTVAKKVIAVTGITLDKPTLSLTEGQEAQLTATVTPDNATDKTVTWSSDKTAVATVDNTGKVKAVAEGTAVITAKAGGKEATCTVTVKAFIAVTSVELNKTELPLKKGESETLVATVKPDNATSKTVTWSSDKTSVATVDSNGKVTAKGGGEATITAKAGDQSATCHVVVTVPVTNITLNKDKITLNVDATFTLTATVTPNDATDKTVTWTSEDPSVAKVENGVVTGLSAGKTYVKATAGEVTKSCEVTVVVPVESVSLNKTTLTLDKGAYETLQATINPSNATDQTLTWSTSKSSVATVDNNGKVTAVNGGEATITVTTSNGKKAECKVTVNVPVTSIQLNKSEMTLSVGQSFTLSVVFNPTDVTDKTVTWESDKPDFASVDANGKVTAKAQGIAVITAKSGGKEAKCTVTVVNDNTEGYDNGNGAWDD